MESCEVQNFEMLTTGQISILCPDIYWYSTTSVMAYYSQITGSFSDHRGQREAATETVRGRLLRLPVLR